MSLDTTPLLSICCITYNHEAFLAKAIEGFLMQKTDFPFEIIIGEDFSKDNTKKIAFSYQYRFPEKIHIITSETNVGPVQNEYRALKACSGKYIAICEGDDYWTDPLKLQKQVNFLENHPGYSLTCHRYRILGQSDNQITDDPLGKFINNDEGFEIDLDLFLKEWIIKSLTLVYRRSSFEPSLILRYRHYRDLHMIYHLLNNGKGYCMNFVGGIYTKHSGGIHGNLDLSGQSINAMKAARDLYKQNKRIELKNYYIDKIKYAKDIAIKENKNLALKYIFKILILTGSLNDFFKNIYHLKQR